MSYIQKHKWHLVIFVILLLIAGVSWYFGSIKTPTTATFAATPTVTPEQPTTFVATPPTTPPINQKTIEQLNNGTIEQIVTSYKLQIITTSTVYDAMKSSQLNFQTKTFSGLGEFVEEINGLKNDPQNGKYWGYFINGVSAQLGISTQIVKPGDLIEWKYGTTDF